MFFDSFNSAETYLEWKKKSFNNDLFLTNLCLGVT